MSNGYMIKEAVQLIGAAKVSLLDLLKGVCNFIFDNIKEMCVSADLVFIPISCIYLIKSDYYLNHNVDRLFLFLTVLTNFIYTLFVFCAVAQVKKSKSHYASLPAVLTLLWGFIRIKMVNSGCTICLWVDISILAVCALSPLCLLCRNIYRKQKKHVSA